MRGNQPLSNEECFRPPAGSYQQNNNYHGDSNPRQGGYYQQQGGRQGYNNHQARGGYQQRGQQQYQQREGFNKSRQTGQYNGQNAQQYSQGQYSQQAAGDFNFPLRQSGGNYGSQFQNGNQFNNTNYHNKGNNFNNNRSHHNPRDNNSRNNQHSIQFNARAFYKPDMIVNPWEKLQSVGQQNNISMPNQRDTMEQKGNINEQPLRTALNSKRDYNRNQQHSFEGGVKWQEKKPQEHRYFNAEKVTNESNAFTQSFMERQRAAQGEDHSGMQRNENGQENEENDCDSDDLNELFEQLQKKKKIAAQQEQNLKNAQSVAEDEKDPNDLTKIQDEQDHFQILREPKPEGGLEAEETWN